MAAINHLPGDIQQILLALNDRMMLEIEWGMAHQALQHGQAQLLLGSDICEDSVVIVAGAKVHARIAALLKQAHESFAEGEMRAAVKKAGGA